MKKRLAVITTHPIQYYAPLFKLLAQRDNIELKVFYTWGEEVLKDKYDPGFGKVITWDIPLLEGYEYEFVENVAKDKGSHHNKGIDNPNLIPLINAWLPDAIMVIGWNFKSHLAALRYFKGKVPIYFRGDSTLLDEQPGFSLKKLARKIALTRIYQYIDKALYVGSNNKAYYKKFGLKDEQLIYTPHAIDNERFTANAEEYKKKALEWRKELGINDHSIVYLFAGKLEPKKEPVLLLNAFVKAQVPDSHLVFVGNGELEQKLKGMAGENKHVHFIEFQNQKSMPVVYHMADIFILPSKGPGETWGLALNEAMACSKAVIASDKCGGAIDLIINGENGYIFHSGDSGDLQKILHLTGNKQTAEKMGISSLNRIKQFNFASIAEAIEVNLQKR